MKFGIELECYGVIRVDVANAFRAEGLEAEVSNYAGSNYSVWQIKTDGSINGSLPFEVVSPVLQGESGIEQVRKVCAILNRLGAQVNTSCGFHVHHDAANWGIREFRYLFKKFIKFETALDAVQPRSRRGNNNNYIKSVSGYHDTTTASGCKARMAEIDSCRSVVQLSRLFNNNRYYKLNLQSFFRSGTVEFRNHAGTIDAVKVENYIRLTAGLVSEAANHVSVQPHAKTVTSKQALDTMLSGMTRRGSINKEIADFYQSRAKTLGEQNA